MGHIALRMIFSAKEIQTFPDRACKVTSQVKAFATIKALAIKPNHLSLVPGTYVLKGEIQLLKVVL